MSFFRKVRALFRSRDARGASTLASSSVIAQLIALSVTPVLSRLYAPESFGYLTLVVSVTGMISPAVAMRLESALMLPREDRVATALLFVGLVTVTVISTITVLALEISFALGWLSKLTDFPGFSLWVGVITFLSGCFVLLGQFALRSRQYRAVAIRNVSQGSTTALAQLGFAFVSSAPGGLVAGYFLGRLAGIVPLWNSMRSQFRQFGKSDIWYGLRRYRAFPLLFAPAALLNAGALAAPIVVAGIWFEVSDAGQFGMAERILAVPLVIVATALGQVVEARLAYHHRQKIHGSASYYLRISAFLAVFSLLVATLVWVGAPALVPAVLGKGWEGAAIIMQLLVPMLVGRIIASPMSKSIVVAGWARVNLALDTLRALLITGILWNCWRVHASLEDLILWTSLVFALVYAVTWVVGLAAATRLDSQTHSDGR